MQPSPAKKQRTDNAVAALVADAEPTGLRASEFVIIHRFLHNPEQPLSLDAIPRFGVVDIGTNKFKKRCLKLPGRLGVVGIPDDRLTKTSAYAARMRAGGCISWWNSMGKNTTGYKFVSQYSSTLESLEWNSKCTIAQKGRFPPIKGADAAPINDIQLGIKDPACMAVPSEDDPFFTAKSSASSGAVFMCELAKTGRGKCKGCSNSIFQNELRLGYKRGKYTAYVHPSCATVAHLPTQSAVESCEGFMELSPENQTVLRAVSLELHSSVGEKSEK